MYVGGQEERGRFTNGGSGGGERRAVKYKSDIHAYLYCNNAHCCK